MAMLNIFIILTGLIFTVYGLILCVMSNLNLGVVLVLLIGLFVMFSGLCYRKIEKVTSKGFLKVCKNIIIILISLEMILVTFIAVYGFNDNSDYTEDAVIVLGAGIRGDRVTFPLKLRLDKAIEYHYKNPDAVIIVSGGQGFQETVSEAYAMEKYLLEQGISKDKIIKEENSFSTAENMKFSKEILDDYFKKDYSVVVITNHFHIFRGVTMAKQTGFKGVSHIHAGLQWYNLMPCFLRESLAVLKMLIVG